MPQYQGIWTLAQAAQLQSTQRWVTDPLYKNTTLLLQADDAANGAQNNTFLDSSSNNFTITRNGNTTQGSFTPYSLQPGAWGNYFPSTSGSYLTIANNAAFTLGQTFTVECWIYRTSNDDGTIVGRWFAGDASGWLFHIYSTGRLSFGIGTGSYSNTSNSTLPLNTWTHVAVSNDSTSKRLYINGVLDGTFASDNITLLGSLNLTICQNSGGGTGWPGYISNLRIVKGTALYTSNFTPSSTPLTAVANTVLLTCQSNRFVDNSTNNFAITVTGTPSVQAFSPFAPQYQYTPSVTGGSGYFDGTGDYLSAAANTALTFGTGDFTVEGWFYANALGGQPTILNNGSDAAGLVITMFSSKIYAYFVGAGNVFGSSGATIVTNTWYHFAWVRSGSTNTFYLNGAVYGATYSSAGNHASTGGVGIGYSVAGTAFAAWNGYIANVRMVKGTAVYTGAFTPPIAPVGTSGPASSYSSTTNVNTTFTSTNTSLLTNFTNAGIVDGTMKNNLETFGNAQISTSVVKYGTGSMYFDGTGDYLSIPYNAALVFDSGNFTVECWFYLTGNAGLNGNNERKAEFASCIVGIPTTAGWEFGLDGNSTTTGTGISFSNRINSSTAYVITATVTVNQNQWNHVAVVRNGTTTTIYLNGISVGSGTLTNQSITSANSLWIGRQNVNSFNHDFPGYIDDLRITKGIARYTANFTPPSVALPRQ